MRPETTCSHPGCGRPATEVAVVDSAWEDASNGSALMVCAEHVDAYVGRGPEDDPVVHARRRPPRPATS